MIKMTPLTRRKLQKLFSQKTVIVSIFILSLLAVGSIFTEFITNSKPVVAYVNNKVIFPAYVDYNREAVGLEGAGTIDYREMKEDMRWALWPIFNWDPFENDNDLDEYMSPPSKVHPMGTDVGGRDVFSRLLYGTRISFIFALSVWILSYVVGIIIGLLQGFVGGKFDLVAQRFVEVFNSIPVFFLLILLISIIQPGLFWLIIINVVFGWIMISYYMRAEALKNRKLTYTEAAYAMGAKPGRILFKHILPNSLIPLITFSPFNIVANIIGLASLDYLGFGVPAPTPSWGELLDQAQRNFQVAWWLAFFPSFFLFLSIVSLNLLGQALRNTFDPRKG